MQLSPFFPKEHFGRIIFSLVMFFFQRLIYLWNVILYHLSFEFFLYMGGVKGLI